MKKLLERFILTEDEEVSVETPEVAVDDAVVIEPEKPSEEVVNSTYESMVNELVNHQWDIINNASGIIANLESETETKFNKEDVIKLLKQLIDDTTINVGLVTRISELIDSKKSDLMTTGIEKAEEIIQDSSEEKGE